MKRIADTLGVARSHLGLQAAPERTRQRRGRRPQPEAELVTEIKALIAGQPSYGYRRTHALLRRQRREQGGAPVNVKRVYRVTGGREKRCHPRHAGRDRSREGNRPGYTLEDGSGCLTIGVHLT